MSVKEVEVTKGATVTKTAADLVRESSLEKLASAPAPKVIVKYETVNSCDGHKWRREVKDNGRYGEWEDMGPSRE